MPEEHTMKFLLQLIIKIHYGDNRWLKNVLTKQSWSKYPVLPDKVGRTIKIIILRRNPLPGPNIGIKTMLLPNLCGTYMTDLNNSLDI